MSRQSQVPHDQRRIGDEDSRQQMQPAPGTLDLTLVLDVAPDIFSALDHFDAVLPQAVAQNAHTRLAHVARSPKYDTGNPTRRHDRRRCQSAASNSGSSLNKSPTRPMSAISKIGASASLLMATIVPASLIPVRCWIAPLMPMAT